MKKSTLRDNGRRISENFMEEREVKLPHEIVAAFFLLSRSSSGFYM